MKLNIKTIFQRLILGLKKGWTTPTLPNHIINLQNKVFIRVLKSLGGISIIFIITHRLELLGNGLLYKICLIICIVFSLIFIIYLLYINYYRINHMYKVLKNNDLDICNSPFDRFSIFAKKLSWYSKGFLEAVAPIAITLGLRKFKFIILKEYISIIIAFLIQYFNNW
jgi:hypothetical protein